MEIKFSGDYVTISDVDLTEIVTVKLTPCTDPEIGANVELDGVIIGGLVRKDYSEREEGFGES